MLKFEGLKEEPKNFVVNGVDFSGKGMTLRDWFAGMALIGMSSETEGWHYGRERIGGNDWKTNMAEDAFAIADAMIVAREKEVEGA